MADEPESLVLHILRQIREEAASFREEVREGFAGVNSRIAELQVGQAALSADLKMVKADVSDIAAVQKNQGARLNAIDGRLALIEKHAGMVDA
jgi:hypothetical protein